MHTKNDTIFFEINIFLQRFQTSVTKRHEIEQKKTKKTTTPPRNGIFGKKPKKQTTGITTQSPGLGKISDYTINRQVQKHLSLTKSPELNRFAGTSYLLHKTAPCKMPADIERRDIGIFIH